MFTIELEDGSETGVLYLINCNENIQGESCGAWCKIVPFLCNCPELGFIIFFEDLYFFLLFQWPIKYPQTFFSLKIKSSVKQKCVNKLFLLKSKILKRLNYRTQEICKIAIRTKNCEFSNYNFANFLRFCDSIFLKF